MTIDVGGRPTVMTDLTINKLEEAFLMGCSDLEACLFADISHQTLYNYQKENPDFVIRKEKLKENPILKARKSVINGLDNDPELSLKFLERKKKAEFSLRTEVTGAEGKPLFLPSDILEKNNLNESNKKEEL